MCTAVSSVLLVWFQPKKYLSLDGDLTFHIFLRIHPSKIGLKLVYYYLYHVEEEFAMDICTHPFNMPFMLFVQTLYFSI